METPIFNILGNTGTQVCSGYYLGLGVVVLVLWCWDLVGVYSTSTLGPDICYILLDYFNLLSSSVLTLGLFLLTTWWQSELISDCAEPRERERRERERW